MGREKRAAEGQPEVIDRQWVKDQSEAEELKRLLTRAAAARGLQIGIKLAGFGSFDGFYVTVEKPAGKRSPQ